MANMYFLEAACNGAATLSSANGPVDNFAQRCGDVAGITLQQ